MLYANCIIMLGSEFEGRKVPDLTAGIYDSY